MKKVEPKKEKAQSAHAQGRLLGKLLSLRQNLAINCTALALLGVGVGLISLMLATTVFGMPMFWLYFDRPMIVLLNLLPPVMLMLTLYFISGRAWIAFSLPASFVLVISMVHFFKVQLRGDPLLVSDILYIREAGTILSYYTLTMNWKIYLATAAFVFGTAFSALALKHKPKLAPFRIVASVVAIGLSVLLYTAVYANADIYAELIPFDAETEWSFARNYMSKGFLYPFINNIESALEEIRGSIPFWYDEQEARLALESFGNTDIPDDKKVNIISIMLEAYTDLSRFGVLEFEGDVYGPLHRLQEESVSGMLVTNVFGGGTIDTERLFLTGNTRLTNFRSPTNSFVHYLKSQGFHAEGLHSGDKWFYDRRPINTLLGLDTYYFLEDYEQGSRTDAFFFPAVMDLYKARDTGKPYFSFNLSYQNHGAYNSTKTSQPWLIARNGMSDESFFILNNYLTGIQDTNVHIENFIDSLRADPVPVVVLMFGDHMPWLGNQSSVYLELGINIDASTDEGYINYYSTEYFIWANDAAKEALGNDFTGDGGSFSPSFLMGEVFRLCSWEGEGYMQALRELQPIIDVINMPVVKVRDNGVLTLMDDLSPESLAAYRRLRGMEIYRLNHFQYQ